MPTRPPRHKPGLKPKAVVAAPAPAIHKPRPREERPGPRQRGYTSAWDRARKGYLIKHPLCVHCLAEGIVTSATVVDHIEPHKGDMVKFWNSLNWQALCAPHHNRKTAKEDGGFGNTRKTHG